MDLHTIFNNPSAYKFCLWMIVTTRRRTLTSIEKLSVGRYVAEARFSPKLQVFETSPFEAQQNQLLALAALRRPILYGGKHEELAT